MPDFLCWFHPSRPLAADDRLFQQASRNADDGGWGFTGDGSAATDGARAALAGHPRWREPELDDVARSRGDAAALAEAWRRHGDRCLERVAGDFALVVLDPRAGVLLAAIDRMGQQSLYLMRARGGVVVANRASLLAGHPDAVAGIDPQALHDYLYFHMLPAPACAHRGVEKLAAAQRLRAAGGTVEIERYWRPTFSETPIDAADVGGELQATLGRAVERQLVAGTGTFLSGGLDSSSVTGMHARLRPGEARAYSIGFDVPGYDEIPYARAAARHFDAALTEYYASPADVADNVAAVVGGFDEPFGNSSALPAYLCARRAREDGITRLLAGDGGDELFAGNARYAKQELFELYARIPAVARRGLLEPLLLGPAGALPGLRKGRSYIRQARIPLPDRLESYNFLHRLDPRSVFAADFLAEIDRERPLRHLRELYALPQGASALNRMLYLDWQVTLADNDLRKVECACRLAGVDVAYPMLDDDVVALSCRIPSREKLHRGRLRHFYREAFRGFLPDAVLDKRKHGFGLPFGLWLRDDRRLHELAGDMLGVVRDRGWIRAAFIDRLFDVHLREHPAFYGEFVWVLMALGIWLERRKR